MTLRQVDVPGPMQIRPSRASKSLISRVQRGASRRRKSATAGRKAIRAIEPIRLLDIDLLPWSLQQVPRRDKELRAAIVHRACPLPKMANAVVRDAARGEHQYYDAALVSVTCGAPTVDLALLGLGTTWIRLASGNSRSDLALRRGAEGLATSLAYHADHLRDLQRVSQHDAHLLGRIVRTPVLSCLCCRC